MSIHSSPAARLVPYRAGKPAMASVAADSRLMSVGALTGGRVVDVNDEELGRIEEIMLDVPSGRIAYAVMSPRLSGVAEKLFAIPWQALTLDAGKECFRLDIDREGVEKAPGFNQDHWPSMADPQWAVSIHAYYGRRPYWE